MKMKSEGEIILEENIAAGLKIVEVFRLKKAKGYKDRYETDWGTKTALGVYEVAHRLVTEGD